MIVNRFLTILADRRELRDIHYRLRFKVFCKETGFENADRFPDKKERDAYDQFATHFLVWDRMEREWVGAMRLVDASKTRLPSEVICHQELVGLEENRNRSAEFSRLCILSDYRHTPSATSFGLHVRGDDANGEPQPVFFRQEDNEIFLRLLRASFAWGKAKRVDYCYFIVNPALARVLTRFGIPLKVVGEPIEHRGLRIPHSYNVHAAEDGMMGSLPGYKRMASNSSAWVKYSDFLAGGAEERLDVQAAIPPQVYNLTTAPSALY